MRVVLDSTEFVADYHMKGNAFRVLQPALERAGTKLYVPVVVVEEVCNSYRRTLESLNADLERARRKIERVRGEAPTIEVLALEEEADKYRHDFMKRLAELHAEILPYPDVPHEEMVRRAIGRSKPFKESGVGYRDTLIWLSVAQLANNHADEIAFVSGNTHDFAENDRLHPSLTADLNPERLPAFEVRYFSSLEKFNSAVILPTLTRLEGLITAFSQPGTTEASRLRRWLDNHLRDEIDWCADIFAPFDSDHASVSMTGIDEISDIRIDDVRLLDDANQILVSATVDVTVDLSVTVEWEEYEEYEDVREFVGPSEPFRTMFTDTSADGSVGVSLVMTTDGYRVLASEVDEVEAGWTWARINPHPRRQT